MPNNYISLNSGPSSYVADANTRFLMRFEGPDNSTIFTDDIGHVITKSGSPIIQSAVALNGETSGKFNGTTDYLNFPGTDFTFTGDFSIEFDFQIISFAGGTAAVIGNYAANAQGNWFFAIVGSTSPIWYINGAGVYVQPLVSYTVGVTYRTQLVRKNGVCSIYINGVSVGNPVAYNGVFGLSTATIGLACRANGVAPSNMYIDQVRISDIARI